MSSTSLPGVRMVTAYCSPSSCLSSGSSPARESGPAEVSPVASNLWTLARTALRIRIAHNLRPWSSPSSGPATSGVLTARSFFWPRACHSHCPTLFPAVARSFRRLSDDADRSGGEPADGRQGSLHRLFRIGFDPRGALKDGTGQRAQLERGQRPARTHVLADAVDEVVRGVGLGIELFGVAEDARVPVGRRPVEDDPVSGPQRPIADGHGVGDDAAVG